MVSTNRLHALTKPDEAPEMSPFDSLMAASGLSAPSSPLDEQSVLSALGRFFRLAGTLTRIPTEKDDTFVLDGNQDRLLVKVSGAQEAPCDVNLQTTALLHIAETAPTLPIPAVLQGTDGEYEYDLSRADADAARVLRVMKFLPGSALSDSHPTREQMAAVGRAQAAITEALSGFTHSRQDRNLVWDLRNFSVLRPLLDRVAAPEDRRLGERIFDAYAEHVQGRIPQLRHQVVHGDFSAHNILVDGDRPEYVSGIIDFGDTTRTAEIFDVAISMSNQLDAHAEDPWRSALDLFSGFANRRTLDGSELSLAPDCGRISQFAAGSDRVLACTARSFARRIRLISRGTRLDRSSIDRDYVVSGCRPHQFRQRIIDQIGHTMELPTAATRPRRPEMVNGFSEDDIHRQPLRIRTRIERRKSLLGPGYQLFYSDPVDVHRGRGVYLYDADGNQYLDAYNNVASVGHSHPAVAEAVSTQLGIINTNTRYVQDQILDYSEDLLSTFPSELDRVTYTCTGSEANDLAIRIARAHTGNTGIIVTRNAYHGVTETVASFSPSLGKSSPLGPHVRIIAEPDSTRRRDLGDIAEFMRSQIRAAIADLNRHGFGLCAFIADSIFSSDGVFSHPTTVLGVLAEEVHRAGGVYIADEVQPGFGRTGDAWWGFQRHHVVPDIVTIGKPMGNGIPVAATVLRNDIGRAFGENVRYFNTFGGSTVPIAAAQAVLDVIRDEGLIDNARIVGTYLLDELRRLCAAWPEVFEVRGTGMFIGIDIIDPESGVPDGALAKAIVDDMRRNFVLVSASGPAGNVLKIRPPLVFSRIDADRLLETLSMSFQRLPSR